MKRIVFALLIALLICPGAYATDLNAPGGKQITLQSEIQRGADAAADAFRTHINFDPIGNIRAFLDVNSLNKQNNTDTDGYYLGAYYRAWTLTKIYVNVIATSPSWYSYHPRSDGQYVKDCADSFYNSFRKQQKSLGLSDDEFFNALGFDESYREKFKTEINTWESQPPK